MNRHMQYIDTLLDEKQIDLTAAFTVPATDGTLNLMQYRVVVEHIAAAPSWEQAAIADTMRRLDFHNADLLPYLRHLSQAIAVGWG